MKKSHESTIDVKGWKERVEKVPFIHLLGMKLVSFNEDTLEMKMKVVPKLINYLGGVHGGAISSLIDTTVYFAIRPFLPQGRGLTTTEIKVNFFCAAQEGILTAKAKILHLGKRTAVGEAEIVDEQGRLIAKGTVGHLIT